MYVNRLRDRCPAGASGGVAQDDGGHEESRLVLEGSLEGSLEASLAQVEMDFSLCHPPDTIMTWGSLAWCYHADGSVLICRTYSIC